VSFVTKLRARAASRRRRIAFPESDDQRVLDAVRALLAQGVAEPVLIVRPGTGGGNGAEHARAEGVRCVDPASDPRRSTVVRWLLERGSSRGLDRDGAEELASRPLYFADSLVALGELDGCVAGAVETTASVLRAALWSVGPASGVRTVSSAFYMVVQPFRSDEEEVLTFADCAVVIEPTAEQLADIAISAARDRRLVVGDEARVAFLSYGTAGSGSGASIDRVRAAVQLVRERAPEVAVDGELQGDAALVPEVALRKSPGSSVAGRANVLIFPSLDAGNIAYKLVQRIAHARSIGPIIQGLARPCSDLSRGASADDIINVAAVNALQASTTDNAITDGPRREKEQ